MSFCINNKFCFIDTFHFLRSSLDSLVKNLGKEDFKYFSQEFDNNVLDIVKKKIFTLMNIRVILKSLKKNCLAKKTFMVA